MSHYEPVPKVVFIVLGTVGVILGVIASDSFTATHGERERVNLHLYMIDGRQVDRSFMVTKRRSALQINGDRGNYSLCYIEKGWLGWGGGWTTLKEGVIDFEYKEK